MNSPQKNPGSPRCTEQSGSTADSIGDQQRERLRRSLDVVVLLGGDSAEREISLQSGQAVETALKTLGYRTRTLDPSLLLPAHDQWSQFGIAFNALHGTYGEDGALQRELGNLGVAFTGSDAKSSRIAFNKANSKQIFRESSLRTPDFATLKATSSVHEICGAALSIGYPLAIKPVQQGSSLGVSIVHRDDSLLDAFRLAGQFDDEILIERAIIGQEWTVAILDGECLPPIRISARNNFFDYSAKYHDEQTQYEINPGDSPSTCQQVANLARAACECVGTQGICRVDLMVDGEGRPWLLEVNTSPGMTSHSLVPKAAARLGWDMAELCERIIFAALPNFPHLQELLSEHD